MGAVGSGRVPTDCASDEGPTSQVVGGDGGLGRRWALSLEEKRPTLGNPEVDPGNLDVREGRGCRKRPIVDIARVQGVADDQNLDSGKRVV